MSRSAPLGVFKRGLRLLCHHPARLQSAEARGKAPIVTLKPVRCGFSTDGDMIGRSFADNSQSELVMAPRAPGTQIKVHCDRLT